MSCYEHMSYIIRLQMSVRSNLAVKSLKIVIGRRKNPTEGFDVLSFRILVSDQSCRADILNICYYIDYSYKYISYTEIFSPASTVFLRYNE